MSHDNLRDDQLLGVLQPFMHKTQILVLDPPLTALHCLLRVARHLRLTFGAPYDRIVSAYKDIKQQTFQTLYLNTSLLPIIVDEGRLAAHSGLQELLYACTSNKVDVVYEEQPYHRRVDPYISPEFWRRQRELKKLGAVQ